MRRKEKINIVTLGCYKNLVDSEVLLKQLSLNDFEIVHNSDSFDYKTVIVNTCGFIHDAKQESIDTILQFAEAKKKSKIKNLFIMGCLSQRYKEELKKEIPEVDEYFGVDCFEDILKKLNAQYKYELIGERVLTTPKHYAYLKIAEGCDRSCSFCAIPIIRGKHISKPIEIIVNEAKSLTKQGVKEIILISQDLSYYGLDLYKKQRLAKLLNDLSLINEIKWIRLQYLYPHKFPKDVIHVMKANNKICNYIDIPFQHISNNVLAKMCRGITREDTYKLIRYFKNEIPGVALRTSLLIGHPGETEDSFKELVEFVRETKFDKLGVFKYSHEEDTFAYKEYDDNIPEKIKQKRYDEIMQLQQDISFSLNQDKIGETYKVLIDRREGEYFIGRTQYDSPEIDGEVLIKDERIVIGEFYEVIITGAEEYDLYGNLII
ncbi:30S ribosomal protein S12 methylthiotransferase RimO [Bacteroidota bacterium]